MARDRFTRPSSRPGQQTERGDSRPLGLRWGGRERPERRGRRGGASPGWTRLIANAPAWILAAVLVAGGTVAAQAQQPEAELAELRARVAALEEQNAELQDAVLKRLPPADNSASAVRYSEAAFPSDLNTFDAEVRTAVDQYLVEKETLEAEKKLAAEDAGNEIGHDLTMTAKWNHGLELSTEDKNFRVHVGGRTQFDTSWFSVDPSVNTPAYLPGGVIYEDGVDFRRARIRMDGTMYETIDWAVEYDFANSLRIPLAAPIDQDVTAFTDVWWTFKSVPVLGNVRVGNQKEQIGFEHLVSSRFLPFMERSYNQDAFYGGAYNGFTPGVQAFDNWDEEMGCWAIGLFKPVDNAFSSGAWDGDRAVTGRLTRLLWYNDEGERLVHVGVASRWFTSTRDRHRFRARDAVRAAPAHCGPSSPTRPRCSGTTAPGSTANWPRSSARGRSRASTC